MARATRATKLEDQPDSDAGSSTAPPPTNRKGPKKRKRSDGADDKDLKDKKRKKEVKSEGEDLDTEDVLDREQTEVKDEDEEGGPSLSSYDASRILDVLQVTDPGHALDRKAQIHGEQFSLRTLLQDPSVVSLRALRNFVQRNAPNPTPRAPPANPALEGFYDLAKNLLDDVAEKSSLSLDKSIVGVEEEKEVETTPKDEIVAKPAKYALHQHLPTGDYFTSAAALSSSEIASMKKGQSSLLAIVPSIPIPPEALPKLGEYATGPSSKRAVPPRKPAMKLSSATFLDYGPYASFAPTFDSDGGQVGRHTLGEWAWMRNKSQKRAQKQRSPPPRLPPPLPPPDIMPEMPAPVDFSAAREFLPADLVDGLVAGLEDAELEAGVSELLARNGRALRRLISLQEDRFRAGQKGKEVPVQVGSEEWELAQEILASLTTLASLRPRSSSSTSTESSLIPPPSLLHTLQRTLPRDPTPGWKGTLSSSRDFALIDNTTVRITGTGTNPVPTPDTPATQLPHTATNTANTTPTTNRAPLPSGSYPYNPRAPTHFNGATPPNPSTPRTGYSTPGGGTYYPQMYNQNSQTPVQGQAPYQYQQYAQTSYQQGTPGAQRAIPNLATKSSAGSSAAAGHWGGGSPAPALPLHLRRPGAVVNGYNSYPQASTAKR